MDRLVAMVLLGLVGLACGGEQPVAPVGGHPTASSMRVVPPASSEQVSSSTSSATASLAASAVPTAQASVQAATSAVLHCPPVAACGEKELRCLGSIAMQAINGPSCHERCIPFDWAKARKERGPESNPNLACNGDLPLHCFDSGQCAPNKVCVLGRESADCVKKTDTDRTSYGPELCGRGTCRLGGACETQAGGLRVCAPK